MPYFCRPLSKALKNARVFKGYDKAQYCTLYYIDSIIHSIDYGITRLTVNTSTSRIYRYIEVRDMTYSVVQHE